MNNYKTLNPKVNLITNIVIIIILLLATIFLFYFLYSNQNKIISFFKPIDFNDKTPPTLTEVTIKSDNATNSKYAEEANTISLQFKVSEELKKDPIITINNQVVKVHKRSDYYVAYYTILNQTISNTLVSFKISDIQDRNGNSGVDVSNTTDQSSVTIVSKGTNISTLQ